jgi:hypothetical protein
MPQLQYEVHGIINVQSTSIATDSAGIFGQMQFPAVNTFNYVAVDYVPNNATVRTYYWQGGVQSSVATTNLTISAGAQLVLRLAFDGFNNVQAWYSTVIGDYGNSTGSWVTAGSPISLPAGLQSAGYIGVYGANTLSGYNASDGVQKVLAFYNTSGGGGSGGAIVDIRGRMQIVQPGIINNIRDSV